MEQFEFVKAAISNANADRPVLDRLHNMAVDVDLSYAERFEALHQMDMVMGCEDDVEYPEADDLESYLDMFVE